MVRGHSWVLNNYLDIADFICYIVAGTLRDVQNFSLINADRRSITPGNLLKVPFGGFLFN